MTLRGIAFGIALFGSALTVHAQEEAGACSGELETLDLTGATADLARLLDLRTDSASSSLMLRRSSDRYAVNVCGDGSLRRLARALAVQPPPARSALLLPVQTTIGFRSAYPRDWNNGELRGAVGLSLTAVGGIRARWGRFEGAVAPAALLEENGHFDFDPYPGEFRSVYAHRWRARFIDLPQRFGNDGIRRISPGQSYVRVNFGGLRAGISTENLTWGPARRNPLLLSSTAPGFPHVFFESARPLDVYIGTASFQLFWARLSESDYFDFEPANDRRGLTGVSGVLTPRGLDGLHIGVSHLHMQPWRDDSPGADLLLGAFRGIDPDSFGFRRDLRLFAFSVRWSTAPAGFEIYGEWARQDSWREWFRLLNPIDAAQAYTLGAQRVWDRGAVAFRLNAEFSHLSDALAHRDVGRGINTYYVSPYMPHGHTHRGQLLGAPIGPGSESQFIGSDLFWKHGRSSLSVERVRYDDDAYYAIWSQIHGPHGHDTELSIRAGHLITLDRFAVEVDVAYSSRYSRWFLGQDNFNFPGYPYRREDNVAARLGVRWQPALQPITW